jgi:hypothetical protein
MPYQDAVLSRYPKAQAVEEPLIVRRPGQRRKGCCSSMPGQSWMLASWAVAPRRPRRGRMRPAGRETPGEESSWSWRGRSATAWRRPAPAAGQYRRLGHHPLDRRHCSAWNVLRVAIPTPRGYQARLHGATSAGPGFAITGLTCISSRLSVQRLLDPVRMGLDAVGYLWRITPLHLLFRIARIMALEQSSTSRGTGRFLGVCWPSWYWNTLTSQSGGGTSEELARIEGPLKPASPRSLPSFLTAGNVETPQPRPPPLDDPTVKEPINHAGR